MKMRILKRTLGGVGLLVVVGIFAVFGGVAAGVFGVVTGSSFFSYRYWSSLCVIKPKEYATNMNDLRLKLGLSSLPDKARPSSHPGFLTGSTVQGSFEGNPDDPIDLINYDINCKYPPFSIKGSATQQELDEPPYALPKYCDEITPTPTPTLGATANSTSKCIPAPAASPTTVAKAPEKTANPYYPYSCPTPTPIPPPIYGLGQSTLKTALEGSNGGSSGPQILEAVGALKVRLTDSNGNPDLSADSEFWGTGFVIANNLFATTCHILEPLFEKDKDGKPIKSNGKFQLRGGVNLYVDFTPGYTNYAHSDPNKEVRAYYVDCSRQTGLDVALLELCPNTDQPVPTPVTLYFDDLKNLEKIPAVLVSYIDLRHPLDEITGEMYQAFIDCKVAESKGMTCVKPKDAKPNDEYKYGPYWKFAMVDGVVAARRCLSVDLLLDLADTSVGSSGALVLSIFQKFEGDPKSPNVVLRPIPLVVGLHKCCAAYFGEEKGYDPPPTISCAALHRTPINQDVSTFSILKDDNLVSILKEHNVKVEDNDGKCLDRFSKCKN